MSNQAAADFETMVHKAQERYQLPPGAKQILLVRHGSSTGMTVETVQLGALTLSDPPLTPDGHAQAKALGAQLARENISAVFVTPMQRTLQTATPLLEATGLTPTTIPDLREVYLGDWEHNFYEHAAKGHPLVKRMFAEEDWSVIPNAESRENFSSRVRAGIHAIADAMAPGTTAASFSHAGTIAEICCQATGSRAFAFTAPDNSSVSRLVILSDGTWKLRSFNELAHLGYQ